MLWNPLEKGQVDHFPFQNGQTGEGGGKQFILEGNRIAANGNHSPYRSGALKYSAVVPNG